MWRGVSHKATLSGYWYKLFLRCLCMSGKHKEPDTLKYLMLDTLLYKMEKGESYPRTFVSILFMIYTKTLIASTQKLSKILDCEKKHLVIETKCPCFSSINPFWGKKKHCSSLKTLSSIVEANLGEKIKIWKASHQQIPCEKYSALEVSQEDKKNLLTKSKLKTVHSINTNL